MIRDRDREEEEEGEEEESFVDINSFICLVAVWYPVPSIFLVIDIAAFPGYALELSIAILLNLAYPGTGMLFICSQMRRYCLVKT